MHWREQKTYYAYIMTNRSRTLYTGVTSNLEQRVWQHKHHVFSGFTAQYKVDRLFLACDRALDPGKLFEIDRIQRGKT